MEILKYVLLKCSKLIRNCFTIVEENFEISAAQMLQIAPNSLIVLLWLMEILKMTWSNAPNHFELFDSFTLIDGNFEICAAQMLINQNDNNELQT